MEGLVGASWTLRPDDFIDASGAPLTREMIAEVEVSVVGTNVAGGCGRCLVPAGDAGPIVFSPGDQCPPPPFVDGASFQIVDGAVVLNPDDPALDSMRAQVAISRPGDCACAEPAFAQATQLSACSLKPDPPYVSSAAISAQGDAVLVSLSPHSLVAIDATERLTDRLDLSGGSRRVRVRSFDPIQTSSRSMFLLARGGGREDSLETEPLELSSAEVIAQAAAPPRLVLRSIPRPDLRLDPRAITALEDGLYVVGAIESRSILRNAPGIVRCRFDGVDVECTEAVVETAPAQPRRAFVV